MAKATQRRPGGQRMVEEGLKPPVVGRGLAPARRPFGAPRAPGPPGPERLVRFALLFYAACLLIAWIWRTGFGGQSLLFRDAGAGFVAPARDVALGALAAAAVIAASAWFTRRTATGAALAQALARLLGPLAWRHCVVLALASGVAEEALFRGALQPQVGLWIASALFGLAHFVPRRELAPWGAFSFGAGLLLGALYEATGNLLAPIVAHVTINAVNLRLLTRELDASRGGRGGSAQRDGVDLDGRPER